MENEKTNAVMKCLDCGYKTGHWDKGKDKAYHKKIMQMEAQFGERFVLTRKDIKLLYSISSCLTDSDNIYVKAAGAEIKIVADFAHALRMNIFSKDWRKQPLYEEFRALAIIGNRCGADEETVKLLRRSIYDRD